MGWAAKQCAQLTLGLGGCPPRLCLPKPLAAAVPGYAQGPELIRKLKVCKTQIRLSLLYPCLIIN